MDSPELADLIAENDRLRRRLAAAEREAADSARQLERYAADLRVTFKSERDRSQQLTRSYMATVRALSNAVEARDAYTGRHAERVSRFAIEVSRELGLPAPDAPEVEFGFLLHDVGKLAVPDAILFKPGPLTSEERTLMSQHTIVGAEIMRDIEFLAEASKVVRSHHERWDGSGYPDGLAGEQIPLSARAFAVADVFDALTTNRPYRVALSVAQARAMIDEQSGSHFDPQVVEAFRRIDDDVLREIAAEAG
jgi:putative nucleotidyltransferase with HDIG domain